MDDCDATDHADGDGDIDSDAGRATDGDAGRNSASVDVRPASPEDAAGLAAVYRDAYAENRDLGFPAKAESATEAEVAGWVRDHRVLVAIADDRLVAGVRLEATDEGRTKLSRLGVRADRKDEGIGGRLLDAAEEAVAAWGHETVWLTTPEDHPYLPDLYRRRGYERTGRYPLDYRDYDEIVLEKRVR